MTIVTVLVSLAMVAMGVFVMDIGRVSIVSQKLETVADAAVLASLRMRVEALEIVASRWQEFGGLMGPLASDGAISLRSTDWTSVEQKAATLKRALSGYQARTTAIVKVIAEANGFSREQVEIIDDRGSRLGIQSASAIVIDEQRREKTLDSLWFKRLWATNEKLSQPAEVTRFHVQTTVPVADGETWTLTRASVGQIRWDVSENDADVRRRGNGGYARAFEEAVDAGAFLPQRWPVFRAVLGQTK